MLWTLAFFVVPFACMVAMSLWQRTGAGLVRTWDLQNYASFFARPHFVEGLVNSLEITVATLADLEAIAAGVDPDAAASETDGDGLDSGMAGQDGHGGGPSPDGGSGGTRRSQRPRRPGRSEGQGRPRPPRCPEQPEGRGRSR